jgi:hypothetical protein
VLAALGRCQRELRHPLRLVDILDRIDDGRPGPEEAWGLVCGTTDAETVVWTDEMGEAWAACRFLMDDPVAARLAFLETYRKRLAVAKAEHHDLHWLVYLGYDRARRAGPVIEAVTAGKLSIAQGKGALAPDEWPPAWHADRQLTEGAIPRDQLVALVSGMVTQLAERMAVERRTAPPVLPAADPEGLREALERSWTTE